MFHLQASRIKNGFNRHPPLPTTDSACFVTRMYGVLPFFNLRKLNPAMGGPADSLPKQAWQLRQGIVSPVPQLYYLQEKSYGLFT